MQQSNNSRKRGIGQVNQPSQPTYQFNNNVDNTDYSNFDFSNAFALDPTLADSNTIDANSFANALSNAPATAFNGSYGAPQSSTDLVRLPRNQQMLQQAGQQEQWNGFGNGMNERPDDEEDENELNMKVALAKRDAQGKRKQIPPFVQKLSSFLDSNNTELIRWSDDGRSFIVLDEDEFARTLIPELFKHNNYASFVRQLNMYGFHKTVNITDGSLRQSEKARKGVKPPSMYSHRYFRKNRPDLLWLIQKPSGKSANKRKREGDHKDGYGSDDERQFSPGPEGQTAGELSGLGGVSDLAALPRHELASVRQELKKLQQSQNLISHMIAQLKEQNDQFYRQATAFQALHDRHENSINAILTFLATFYNRSLDGHSGQNLVNMFSNANQNNQQRTGGVVEEFNDATPEVNNQQVQRYVKRPPLLLPPGPDTTTSQYPMGSIITTEPNSVRPSQSPPGSRIKRESTTSIPPVTRSNEPPRQSSRTPNPPKPETNTSNFNSVTPESGDMMSLINSVNATNAASPPSTTTPAFDFHSALDHYQTANGNSPLTPQQRDDMLALIANHQRQQSSSNSNPNQNNNALISPTPPPMPDLAQLRQTQQQLEMLTNMQRQQDEKVQDLHRRLQPLSPTGTIPGLRGSGGGDETNPWDLGSNFGGSSNGGATGNGGEFDLGSFLNVGGGDDEIDWNFGGDGDADGEGEGDVEDLFGDGGDGGGDGITGGVGGGGHGDGNGDDGEGVSGGGRVESVVSSEATSPVAATVEEVQEGNDAPRKRLRTR